MGFIDLISKKLYAAAVAALLALALGMAGYIAYLKVEVAHGDARYAQLEAKVQGEQKERERVAREDSEKRAREQFRHAEIQQENVNAFHQQEAADRARDRERDAELDRLRHDIVAYAAGGDRKGEADPDTCRSERDRSRSLGAALEEALGLQGEAEVFIRQRDREVKLLKGVISNDRELQQ